MAKWIERSASGVYRIPLFRGWAVGFLFERWAFEWVRFDRYEPGWSVVICGIHIGRKADKENWTHETAQTEARTNTS